MARKISFDAPDAETAPSSEETHPTPMQKVRPLLGIERTIRQPSAVGAISQSLGELPRGSNAPIRSSRS